MTTPVQTNKIVFFDSDGEPLQNGYIYVGQPNTDPQTTPKTVTFTDSGGNAFTAAQPLRTIDGRIAYNGKPIAATIEGPYSMLILDSGQKQVDYIREYTPASAGGESVADFSNLTRIGLSLADLKVLDVSVGQMLENTHKIAIGDDLGAEWLVVGNTGNPGDDVDLIDFDNGLQGVRLNNKLYTKDYVSPSEYVASTQLGTFYLDPPQYVYNSTSANGIRDTWTNINLNAYVPTEATAALLRVRLGVTAPSASLESLSLSVHARKTGSGAVNDSTLVARASQYVNTAKVIYADAVGDFSVKVTSGGSRSFDIYISANDPLPNSLNVDLTLRVAVVGYIVNPTESAA